MKPRFIWVPLTAILLATACNVLAEGLYRWTDEQGNVHYGDAPSPEALQPEERRFTDSTLPDAGLPYETRRAKEAFPVTLYVADNCKSPCQRARDLLNKRGIPFTQKNITTQEDIDNFRKLTGMDSVPVLTVGDNLLTKFLVEEWNKELDMAGYPKTAHYGFRPIGPPPPAPAPPAQPASGQPPTSDSENTLPQNNE